MANRIKIRPVLTRCFASSYAAFKANQRVIANRGGTRSGKTYSLLVLLTCLAINGTCKTTDVVSESLPHLKRGALNDFNDILDSFHLVEGTHYTANKTDRIYTFKQSGSMIRFFSADDWGKVKGSRRDILFINEANRIPWETYRQLAVRTTKCIFIDWNPDAEFWFEQKGIAVRENTTEIVTTYKDNPFLGKEQIEDIESNKDDAEWWKVYGLGQIGRPQGLIYKRWEQCREIPPTARLVARGLDFGFTNDPTAIVDVYLYDGKLWLDERLYRNGLTNDKIAAALKLMPTAHMVCDSAEMKSIAELRNYGCNNVEPALKGADSIRAGIQILQRYEIMVTQRSLNLIRELRSYKWKENAITGELLNEPIDKFNHALDAVRYVALNYLRQRGTGTARAHTNRI